MHTIGYKADVVRNCRNVCGGADCRAEKRVAQRHGGHRHCELTIGAAVIRGHRVRAGRQLLVR